MQEALLFNNQHATVVDLKKIAKAAKWLLLTIFAPVRLVFATLFTPPPEQRYIEESRLKAMQLRGHF